MLSGSLLSFLFSLFTAAAAEGEDGGVDQGAQDQARQAGAAQARAQARKLPSLPLLPTYPRSPCGAAVERGMYLGEGCRVSDRVGLPPN